MQLKSAEVINKVFDKKIRNNSRKIHITAKEGNFLNKDDFIDYQITNQSDTYRVLYEAELAENLVGTDYFYLSTTETEFVSGKLFEAKNKK